MTPTQLTDQIMKVKDLYGIEFPEEWPDIMCHLFLFRFGNTLFADPLWRPKFNWTHEPGKKPYTGQGRYTHFRYLVEKIFPESFEWQEWSARGAKLLCEGHQWIGFAGCGASGKSTVCGLYGLFFYLCNPADTAVVCISTTIEQAKKRIWREVTRFHQEFISKIPGFQTEQIDAPHPMIYANIKDRAHVMAVVAVAQGNEDKGIASLKGFHPKRLFVIGDELDSITQAVVDVCRINLKSGTEEFQFAGLGNSGSRFDPHGKLCEPVDGFESLTPDSIRWTSKCGAECLLFNGYKSPAVSEPGKYRGLITKENIDDIVSHYGTNSKYVWSMVMGLWAPDGVDNIVIPESFFIRFKCRDSVTWRDSFTTCSSTDPAFGGDRCAYRPFRYGHDIEGNLKILFLPTRIIPISQNDPENPAEYQIARKVEEWNKELNILPENTIIDCTGTGRGAASVLQREYSSKIVLCEFGGMPSESPVSQTNRKSCREEYDRKVTELYFSFREFVSAGMVRGLDDETCAEFSTREFTIKGTGRGKKMSVESKRDFKARGFRSPDLSDACVEAVELLKRKRVLPMFEGSIQSKAQEGWSRLVRHFDIDAKVVYSELF